MRIITAKNLTLRVSETDTPGAPALAIGGSTDGASPPERVAATADSSLGASFRIIQVVGHLPGVENPEAHASAVVPFLKEPANV